jgi:hypothetical protein
MQVVRRAPRNEMRAQALDIPWSPSARPPPFPPSVRTSSVIEAEEQRSCWKSHGESTGNEARASRRRTSQGRPQEIGVKAERARGPPLTVMAARS